MVDAPYPARFTFVGKSDRLEKIRWQIKRDHLVTYRTHAFVAGTDSPFSAEGTPGQVGSEAESGEPFAVYRLEHHFDI